MSAEAEYTALVEKARDGESDAANKLAELIRPRLNVYLYRLTLDTHLSEDICQESLLEMFRYITHLEQSGKFWPWLRRIALNKVYLHLNRKKKSREIPLPISDNLVCPQLENEGLKKMITDEWKDTVLAAMHQLKPRHREVLVMRCFEDMEYSDIARDMGCSEFGIRMLFFRAKKAFAKQLARRGIKKKYLLPALTLFAHLTAGPESKAAAAVSASTLKTGPAAAAACTLTSKTAAAAAVTIIAAGTALSPAARDYISGAKGPVSATGSFITSVNGEKNHDEQTWHYFPEGVDGPVISKKMVGGGNNTAPRCVWVQDGKANYVYESETGKVCITNHNPWQKDAAGAFLPTDSYEVTEFLSKHTERPLQNFGRIDSREKNLVIISSYDNSQKQYDCFITRHQNILSEEYFKYAWPQNADIIDRRDIIHKQGYAWFTMDIQTASGRAAGFGRMPFVYETSLVNPAFINLYLNDGLAVRDDYNNRAYVSDTESDRRRTMPGGTFFKGLGRPWMGMHTVDCLRRDAAASFIDFKTDFYDNDKYCRLSMYLAKCTVKYVVDMENDWVDSAEVITNNKVTDALLRLNFSYFSKKPDSADIKHSKFRQDSIKEANFSPYSLWIVDLAEVNLVK